ncbi:MAG: hypothetical protein ACSHYB_04920 [Roseibacillus sp.]
MNTLPQKGMIAATILIALGLLGYFAGGMASLTALIPTFLGLPLLLSSRFAKNPKRRKLWMHLAAFLALLGFIAPLGRIIPKLAQGEFELNMATSSMLLMIVTCGIFVFLCVQSFRAARKTK